MGNNGFGYIISAVVIIIVAVGLMALSTINFCTQCTGWSAFNPLCQAGYVSCVATMGTVHLVMRLIAFILIIAAGVKIVKGGN